MSYCRFSHNDHQCDVYAYEDVNGGITVHVAGKRYVFKSPLPAPALPADSVAWFERHELVSEMLKQATMVSIDLPYAGKTRDGMSYEDAAAFLQELRQLGYRVPQYAIDELLKDAAEEAGDAP